MLFYAFRASNPLQNQAFFAPEMKGEYDWSTRCGIGGTEEENKTNDETKEVCIIDKETMTRLRDKLRPRLIDYLDREQIPYDARTLIRCPHCGEQATAYDDGTWYCNGFTGCQRRGDVVDYAMTVQGKGETDVIRYLCRMFGLKITELEFVTSDEVMDMEFTEPVFVVDGLIPRGLSLFCGQSKIGKSWLALWLAHHVSTGQAVWGFPVRQCEVMYLCLEDTLDRLQRRLVEVTGGESGRIYLATQAEIMGSGLEEQLVNSLTGHPDVGLVIIDTLQKIRELKSEQCSYAGDYNAMSRLKTIADRFGVAVLAVHHTRKANSVDPFQRVSGTTGLMGSADSTFVLLKDERAGSELKLFGTGRDVRDLELGLQFRHNPVDWVLTESSVGQFRPSRDRELKAIAAFVAGAHSWEGTATALTERLAAADPALLLAPNAVTRILNAAGGLTEKQYGFTCCPRRDGNTKLLQLSVAGRPVS